MNTDMYHPQDPRANNPNNFSFQRNNHSGILLGNSSTNFQAPNVMYNSYFPGAVQPGFNSQNPPVFMFRERKGKINWRNIANLDVDDLIGRGDVRSLETHLSNITFSNIEKEDIETFGDATLLKLFRLSQYGLEYLLNCQNYLSGQSQVLDNQYRHSEDRVKPLEDQARRNQSEILNLKADIKEKKELISAYQNTLNKPIFKCHICSKYFQSKEYLDAHFDRRHPNNQTPTEERIVKLVAKEVATSPLVTLKATGRDRYGKTYNEDSTMEATRVEHGVQTLSTNATVDNTQNSALLEKIMTQYKQEEDLKLSQMNSNIQDRLQELLRSNYELTNKLAELEKKIENQKHVEVDTPQFERTIRKPSGNLNEELSALEKKETPKKTFQPTRFIISR